ncbi:MAG: aconitase family protein, partial [Akkermansia muciniphila]
AKKAVERGLKVPPHVKTSIAPGSRIASDYFAANRLQESLDALGFETVGYGCTTCIGNSGPLNPELEQTVRDNDIVAASVLSGNRNFEARIHASIKTNFLMSPPLVVAFALAGRVDIDFQTEPLGTDRSGNPVFLKDLWPSSGEIAEAVAKSRARRPTDFTPSRRTRIPAGQPCTRRKALSSSGMNTPPTFRTLPSSAASTASPAHWRISWMPAPWAFSAIP